MVIGTRIIEPILLLVCLKGARYLEFQQNHIKRLIIDLPSEISEQMHFLQNGSPPHKPDKL